MLLLSIHVQVVLLPNTLKQRRRLFLLLIRAAGGRLVRRRLGAALGAAVLFDLGGSGACVAVILAGGGDDFADFFLVAPVGEVKVLVSVLETWGTRVEERGDRTEEGCGLTFWLLV